MKKAVRILGLAILMASGAASADWGYYQNYGYDPVDASINQEINRIDMRERREIMHELQEGDYRGVERVIQREEARKQRLRQEAEHDYYRDQPYNQYQYNVYPSYNQYNRFQPDPILELFLGLW